MKKAIFFLFSLLFVLQLNAQKEMAFFNHLIQQEYEQLGLYFGEDINICIDDFEDVLNKGAALQKLKAFFASNKPKSFKIKHKGSSKGNQSSYYVSDLNTSNGDYRLFVYFNKTANSSKISELRIESN